jgi:2-polyprenyl-3-methyl-5-hydroxy-6-metoxy-1,4-benzoquinol methylase
MSHDSTLDPLSDAKVVDSWNKNTKPWTDAVRGNQIESRRLVTNQAVVDAVIARRPRTALDIGCGEGWLSRALHEHGVEVTGIDVVPGLIDEANAAGGGTFSVVSYEDIIAGKFRAQVDVAVANFALIGGDAVDELIKTVPQLLTPSGALVIQTIHPVIGTGDAPYEDGWRTGSWAGFSTDFVDPAPWYFRTIGSWLRLFEAAGLRLVELREPVHPVTHRPASIIFVAAR